jgi:two-component system nitrate/nitrite response regulator NarL
VPGPREHLAVLLADDHAVARAGVRADLEASGYRICAEASDAEQAVAAALRELPDICLLDVGMPGGGIAAARAILERLPATRVVMLTISHDAHDVSAAAEAGAWGYVFKDDLPERLARALESVVRGQTAFPRVPHAG